jgi:dipeptidyl aminopeptidase/acylaminoacyl peptidase
LTNLANSWKQCIRSMLKIILTLCIVIGAGSLYHIYMKEKSMLIPRKVLFDNPDCAAVRISPDGKWLSYLAPKDGVLNIWVKNLSTGKTKVITDDKKRGLRTYAWAYDNQHILYVKDKEGDENWQLYKVDVATGLSTLLTPEKGVHTKIIKASHLHPNKVLIGLNHRAPQYHDVYMVDIKAGTKTLVLENKEFADFLADDELDLIMAIKSNEKAEAVYYTEDGKHKWKLYRTVALEDVLTTTPLSLDASREWMYWLDSEGTDKTNLVKIHRKTKEKQVIVKGKQADLSEIVIHPMTKEILAVGENYMREILTPLTPEMAKDLEVLRAVDDGEITIASTTLDHSKWIVAFMDDQKPGRYYLYDSNTKKAEFLFYNKKEWVELPFVKMEPLELKTRDGLTMVSYLSKPANAKPGVPMPMVLYVHGGPVARDEWGINPTHQWLANRGYAVLSVNFRGSTGFGKSFIQASYGEWCGKMHEDLIDAVNWAIQEGIADPKKIAIYGGSYGGFASLLGVTITPDVFACAVDVVGPSNLVTLMETIPPYWKSEYELLKIWVGGDPATEKGKKFLMSRSPISHIHNIKKPLLIAQGANDPRVKQAESDQIVHALQAKGIPVTYLLFPDEGHGFARPVNRLAYQAATEVFLHQNLGGAVEPMGDEAKKSTMKVVAGNIGQR